MGCLIVATMYQLATSIKLILNEVDIRTVKRRSRVVNIVTCFVLFLHVTFVIAIYGIWVNSTYIMFIMITIEYFLLSLGYTLTIVYLLQTCNRLS